MENKNAFTRFLAITGMVLAWLPILAPIFFSALFFLRAGFFRIDYLMPAELFVLVLIGGGLLLWAALRAHTLRALIGWTLGSAVLLLVISQGVAVATGLAQGTIEPGGWQLALVLALLAGYTLAVIALGIGGILLVKKVFESIDPFKI